jgi:hypothetical protein
MSTFQFIHGSIKHAVAVTPHLELLLGRAPMFSVKWVAYRDDTQPIEVENSVLEDMNEVVSSCLKRMEIVRLRHPKTPPDGFIVFDGEGREVHRWFGTSHR